MTGKKKHRGEEEFKSLIKSPESDRGAVRGVRKRLKRAYCVDILTQEPQFRRS